MPPKITLAQAKGLPSIPPERFSPEGPTCVSWVNSPNARNPLDTESRERRGRRERKDFDGCESA